MARKPSPAEIEKANDRERQARRRESMRAEGRPLTGVVDRCLIEALAFELARTPLPAEGLAAAVVPVGRLMRTARRILHKREGYDLNASKAAVIGRLSKRAEHEDIDYIPSLHPDAGVPVVERVRRRQVELEEFLL